MTKSIVALLSDQELLAEVKVAAGREREATARLIALLAQVDERRLYLGEGCSSFTVSRETYELRRIQDLLRHSIPNGDPAAIFDRALTVLVADLEQAKLAATERPRAARPTASGSRHIPAAVRREVWKRDGGQCAFVGTHGRCSERGFLEFHHVEPHAVGGEAVVQNVELRCRAHNVHEAKQYFGSRLPLLAKEERHAYVF